MSKTLVVIIPLLLSVAFLTLLERKFIGIVGLRLGPNKVSIGGFLQPMGDALKLGNKSMNNLSNFSFTIFYLSSMLTLSFSICLYILLFSYPKIHSVKYGLLIFFLVLTFNSFVAILIGWSSFSKFSLLGSLRTVAQLISYEAVLYICLFFLIFLQNSFDLGNFFFSELAPLAIIFIPCFYIWVPSFLAELNRTPYDFSESESELVSGFNTEFGSSCFTLIFLAEYGNIIFFCLLTSFLFFLSQISLSFLFLVLVIWFRSVLPRFRFDKLMSLAWKFFIPFMTVYFCCLLTFFI